MVKNRFAGPYGDGSTEYERYLRVPELLSLQKPPERRSDPDELLFQVIHQVEELWMKVIVHDLGAIAEYLDADRCVDAVRLFDRIAQLQGMAEHQLRLFETLLPNAYIEIRKGLGSGSGMDSPGFNRINAIAPKIWEAYEGAVKRRNTEVLDVYEKLDSHPDLLAVAEKLLNFDAAMQRFKLEHLMTVRRIIGMGTASLRGNPAEMLERSAHLTYFPMLWAIRDRLFMDFKGGSLAL